MTEQLDLKLGDFGISEVADKEGLVQPGPLGFMGTSVFASPEVWHG